MYHSASGVDEFVSKRLPQFGYAVDVGANDGLFGSNSMYFEENGWYVMCIEPNPLLKDRIAANRKLYRPVACGSGNEDMEFVIVGDPPYASGSGFHVKEARKFHVFSEKEEVVVVKVLTLDCILESSGFPRLDYLTMDCEGHEIEVLKGIDLNKWTPRIIVAESWESSELFDIFLKLFNYSFIKKLGFDYIYERN